MHDSHQILDLKKQQIHSNLELMCNDVRDAVDGAIRCLVKQDPDVCEAIIRNDAAVNEKRRLIEQDCLVAIASQQPVANDLRDIMASMHIAEELERMGDYACDIAASILKMDSVDLHHLALLDIQTMAGLFQQMLSLVKRAHLEGDAQMALKVGKLDDELDAYLKKVKNTLLNAMRTDSANVHNGSYMLWIAHNLERCGDRTTNIAEQVVFRLRGEVVDLD